MAYISERDLRPLRIRLTSSNIVLTYGSVVNVAYLTPRLQVMNTNFKSRSVRAIKDSRERTDIQRYQSTYKVMLMYIACLCPNLVSVHFYAIPILHFKFHNFFIYLYTVFEFE